MELKLEQVFSQGRKDEQFCILSRYCHLSVSVEVSAGRDLIDPISRVPTSINSCDLSSVELLFLQLWIIGGDCSYWPALLRCPIVGEESRSQVITITSPATSRTITKCFGSGQPK